LLIEQIEERYNVIRDTDGKLILIGKQDGMPILGLDGKSPVNVLEGNTLWHVLGGGMQGAKNEDQKMFDAIMRYRGASGSGADGSMNARPISSRDSEKPAESKRHLIASDFCICRGQL
jgi:hypothetical protein